MMHSPDPRPDYALTDDLAADARAALRMLVAGADGGAGPRLLFARGGQLVELAPDDAGGTQIRELSPERCRTFLAAAARWVRLRVNADGEEVARDTYVPRDIASDILARPEWPGIPPLRTVVSHPWVRCEGPRAGELVCEPGYDRVSSTWGAWSPAFADAVREGVESMSPGAALAALDDMLADFPFADGRGGPHHASALAAWLTAAARPGIAGNVPLWLVEASTRGSGKGKLCNVVLLSVYPTPTRNGGGFPADDEELDKRLLAIARAGMDRVLFDNVTTVLGGAGLDAALTSAETGYQGRILGQSTMASLPLRPVWVANGNNVRIGGDLDRRILVTRLDPEMPDPETRTGFRHPRLEEAVREGRPRLLAAALRLVRHGIAHPGPALGSFERWGQVVRGALLALDFPDPWEAGAQIREAHTDDAHTAIVWAWSVVWGPSHMAVRDIIDAVEEPPSPQVPASHAAALEVLGTELLEVAAERRGRGIAGKRLGQWLSRHRDRVVRCADGRLRRIVAPVDADGARARTSKGAAWAVEEVGGA